MNVIPLPASHPDLAKQALPNIVAFFEGLKREDLRTLEHLYARHARFKDPFNDVQGLVEIEAVFAHMFQTLEMPHFTVQARMAQGQQAFVTWDFRFRRKGQPDWQTIHGATRFKFDADGLIIEHRDYWDAAEELYEKLPLVGMLMRWLKRRVMRHPG